MSFYPPDDCQTAADVLARAKRSDTWRRESYKPRPVVIPPPAEPSAPPAVEIPATPAVIKKIVAAVMDYLRVSEVDFYSERRAKPVALARQISMYLAKNHTSWSLPRIGRAMGGRDHTTVLHACHKIKVRLANGDASITAPVQAIEHYLATGERNFPPPEPEPEVSELEFYPPRKWWHDDVIELKRLWLKEGLHQAEIARRMKRSPSAIYWKLRKLDLRGAREE